MTMAHLDIVEDPRGAIASGSDVGAAGVGATARRAFGVIGYIAVRFGMLLASPATASGIHPLMSGKYRVNLGANLARRDFAASADVGTGPPGSTPVIDFERSVGVDDRPDRFNIEFG
jgi:hypothetical protein